MMWTLAFYLYLYIGPTMSEPECRPTISDGLVGIHEMGGFISLECEISTCNNLTKVAFEKTNFEEAWIRVFEGVNKTYHRVLGANPEYTLDRRNDYYPYRTKHSLHINPLILQDHGKWRCVVYDAKQREHKSEPLEFNIYVPPADGHFFIESNNSYLVIDQKQKITCSVDGIHPEPDVLFKVDGVEEDSNVTRKQREDQLWVVMNTIEIKFDVVGVHTVVCVLRAKARDNWLEDNINITVQEAAIVIYPVHDLTTIINVDTSLFLGCRGTGFNPHITWNRDNEIISANDTRYIIKEKCNNSKCNGSISSTYMDLVSTCEHKQQYSGVYTCVISQKPPYRSSVTSSNMTVTFTDNFCKEESIGEPIGWSVLGIVCIAFIASLIGYLVYLKYRNRRSKDQKEVFQNLLELNPDYPDIHFYKSLKLQHIIRPDYATTKPLKLCVQSRGYDQVVLFEFGTNRVFLHDIDDLKQSQVCTCNVQIDDMIRTSQDTFVVTERDTRDIHLLHFTDQKFYIRDTMPGDTDSRRTLICDLSNKSNTFIKCDISPELYSPYDIRIYRVDITHDKLNPSNITTVTVNKAMPYYISPSADNTKLIIRTSDGLLYTVDLDTKRVTNDDRYVEYIDGCVWSLFIDKHDNTILGDSSRIHVCTADDQHSIVQEVDEPAHGITVSDRQMVLICGRLGGLHHIKVFQLMNK